MGKMILGIIQFIYIFWYMDAFLGAPRKRYENIAKRYKIIFKIIAYISTFILIKYVDVILGIGELIFLLIFEFVTFFGLDLRITEDDLEGKMKGII